MGLGPPLFVRGLPVSEQHENPENPPRASRGGVLRTDEEALAFDLDLGEAVGSNTSPDRLQDDVWMPLSRR